MDKPLSQETSKYPPLLSKLGEMYSGNKSELVKCTETLPKILHGTEAPSTYRGVLEGSALINMGKATKNQSFKDYCSAVFICQMEKNGRVYLSRRSDMAFETYKQ